MKCFLKLIFVFFIITIISCQEEPSASFTTSKTSALPEESILFNNLSTNANHFDWDFGDGNTSNEKNPTHTYLTEGTYSITLIAYSKNGKKSSSITHTITIGYAPAGNFSYSPRYPKPGENVHFVDNTSNNPSAWHWDFGDGTSSNEKNPNHIYNYTNTFHVTLNVTNDFGTFEQKDTVMVIDYTPISPSVDFAYTLGTFFTISFRDSSIGSPNLWLWNFGDGSTSNLQNPQHQFAHGGLYNVTLRAFNLAGSNQITKTLNLPSNISEASFIYSEEENYTIHFIDKSNYNPLLWEWNFGDGTSSNLQNPIHQYSQLGTYTVTLKVTNLAGANQKTQQVHVSNFNYSFMVGNYNVVDQSQSNSISYSEVITSTTEPNKFYTSSFGGLTNASVYFLLSGTTVYVPTQIVHCGTPPNDLDHKFNGDGYFIQDNDMVNIILFYRDSTYLGAYNHTARYNTIKPK